MSAEGHAGGCLCGAVRYLAEGGPYRVGLCHCLDCRKHGGAPFGAFAIFPAGKVRFTGEEPGIYASPTHSRRCHCRRCGSPVFGCAEGSDEVELHLGSFDEVGLFAPTYELWTIRREPWLPAIPSIVRHYERDRPGPGRSEP
ncbi:MAG: GFA family protein [Geminicoccaceae bacterium]